MAYAARRSAPQAAPARPVSRPAPQAYAPVQSTVSFGESGRFERGLERRWENAWNRARASGGITR